MIQKRNGPNNESLESWPSVARNKGADDNSKYRRISITLRSTNGERSVLKLEDFVHSDYMVCVSIRMLWERDRKAILEIQIE